MNIEKIKRLVSSIRKSEIVEIEDVDLLSGTMSSRIKYQICDIIDKDNKFIFSNILEFIEAMKKSNAIKHDRILNLSKEVTKLLNDRGLNENETFAVEFLPRNM